MSEDSTYDIYRTREDTFAPPGPCNCVGGLLVVESTFFFENVDPATNRPPPHNCNCNPTNTVIATEFHSIISNIFPNKWS